MLQHMRYKDAQFFLSKSCLNHIFVNKAKLGVKETISLHIALININIQVIN